MGLGIGVGSLAYLIYIGDLESTSGRVVAKGAVRRLQEAGFTRVDRRPEAFGLVASR